MKTETIELNFVGKLINVVCGVLFVLIVIPLTMFMADGLILGPAYLLIGFVEEQRCSLIFWGALLTVLGVVFLWQSVSPSVDLERIFYSWLERNFGRKVVKEIPDRTSGIKVSQNTNKSYSSNTHNNTSHNSSSGSSVSSVQSFRNYVDKEANEIIKNNNITSNEDKSVANLLAINNIKHSPEAISNIYNIPIEKAKEVEENITIEEEKKVSNHVSYEGRISTSDKNKMKSILGYKCAACGKDMSEIYGNIGHNYIELHHKVPYAEMKEDETRTLTENEFCVLCPDCHRMIHKLPDAGDIDMLVRIIKLNKKD